MIKRKRGKFRLNMLVERLFDGSGALRGFGFRIKQVRGCLVKDKYGRWHNTKALKIMEVS